jgi:hypothetical protein
MWHIVYLSFDSSPSGRNYIGKHSTDNLHDGYLGSFKDKTFTPDTQIILGYFKTPEAAVAAEIQWQRVFQVVSDPTYANRSYQTSTGWDTTGNRLSDEQRKKISERLQGIGHPFYGKKRPEHAERMRAKPPAQRPEVRDKISKTMTGDHHHNKRPEMRQKISEIMTGCRWWTNGVSNTRSVECPGPGWVIGRCKPKQTQ